MNTSNGTLCELPIIPLRGLVVLPGLPGSLVVGRAESVAAVEAARSSTTPQMFLIPLRNETLEPNPDLADLWHLGTLVNLIGVFPEEGRDGATGLRIAFDGVRPAQVVQITQTSPFLSAQCALLKPSPDPDPSSELEPLKFDLIEAYVEADLQEAIEDGMQEEDARERAGYIREDMTSLPSDTMACKLAYRLRPQVADLIAFLEMPRLSDRLRWLLQEWGKRK